MDDLSKGVTPPSGGGLRALLFACSDAVIASDAGGTIVAGNPAAIELLGYSEPELREFSLAAMMRPLGPDKVLVSRADGSQLEADLTQVPDPDEPGTSWTLLRDPIGRRTAAQATAELRDTNRVLRALNDAAFEAVFMHSEGIIHVANRAAEEYAGVGPGQLIGRPVLDFVAPRCLEDVTQRVRKGRDDPYETICVRQDGEEYPVEVRPRTTSVRLGGGLLRVTAMRDLSRQRTLELQLRRTQKMEAIGRLAGGVAHDFNNLLSVILNATELARLDLEPNHPSRIELDAVLDATQRGTDLTRQLLAFGRRTLEEPEVIDANAALESMRGILCRLIDSSIELRVALPPAPVHLLMDPTQFEQVILNLALNARDAMPEGGELRIQLRERRVDAAFAATHLGLSPGPHVELCVTDEGTGMDAETRAHIFEPFFTTKGRGKGTGLGLATVFTAVQRAKGDIWVESEVGEGARFTCIFPRADAPPTAVGAAPPEGPPPEDPPADPQPALHTVLVTEDEAAVRRIVATLLERGGYRVLEASGPREALALADAHTVDLLLTDVVMPVHGGIELAALLCAQRPALRVVFMSGYPREQLLREGAREGARESSPRFGHAPFLSKPVTAAALLSTVASALEGRGSPSCAPS